MAPEQRAEPDAAGHVGVSRWSVDGDLFRLLIERGATSILVIDDALHVVEASPNLAPQIGWRPERLVGQVITNLLHPADIPEALAWRAQPASRGVFTGRIRHADGSWRWWEGSIVAEDTGSGLWVLFATDITERRTAESAQERAKNALAATESVHRALVEHATDGIIMLDERATILDFNPAAERIFGYSADEAVGQHVGLLMVPGSRPLHDRAMASRLEHSEPVSIPSREVTAQRADGSRFPCDVTVTEVTIAGTRRFVGTLRDLTHTKELQAALERQAHQDALTGLANRSWLHECLRRELERDRRRGTAPRSTAVVFLDLDRFKVVNDSLGHAHGDLALRQAAERLRLNVREDDLIARAGGDEFVVVCPATSPTDAVHLAERLVASLREPLVVDGREIVLSASSGVAFATAESTVDTLLRDADIAMYTAKETGRDRVATFDEAMRQRAVQRFELEADLREALQYGRLACFYQPSFDLASGEWCSSEALVRLEHPHRGLLAPGEFIPLAEETGLIVAIGVAVLRMATLQSISWHGVAPSHHTTWVNASPHHLARPDFADMVEGIIGDLAPTRGSIGIEVTESALMVDPELAGRHLRRLHDQGIRIAIDDFGTGYSSLARLYHYPVDVLKIDRSFVRDLTGPSSSRPIVDAVVHLAHALGAITIAEGVERPEQIPVLRDLGCDRASGFLLGRPVPAIVPPPLTHHLLTGISSPSSN